METSASHRLPVNCNFLPKLRFLPSNTIFDQERAPAPYCLERHQLPKKKLPDSKIWKEDSIPWLPCFLELIPRNVFVTEICKGLSTSDLFFSFNAVGERVAFAVQRIKVDLLQNLKQSSKIGIKWCQGKWCSFWARLACSKNFERRAALCKGLMLNSTYSIFVTDFWNLSVLFFTFLSFLCTSQISFTN